MSNGIKKKIMRRVYTIWLVRKMTSSLAVEIYTFIVIFSAALYHISFFDVLKNAFNSSSFWTLYQFFLNNFMLADSVSQFLTMGMIMMILIFAWELFRKKDTPILKPTP